MSDDRKTLTAWGDDVALMGPEAPKWDGHIKHLVEYLLTVYERFGNTAVTANLQWGASALWKRDEQAEQIADLQSRLSAAEARIKEIEDAALPLMDECGVRATNMADLAECLANELKLRLASEADAERCREFVRAVYVDKDESFDAYDEECMRDELDRRIAARASGEGAK